eukprot:scaffold163010_cov66-Attheya_sp.AAC.4
MKFCNIFTVTFFSLMFGVDAWHHIRGNKGVITLDEIIAKMEGHHFHLRRLSHSLQQENMIRTSDMLRYLEVSQECVDDTNELQNSTVLQDFWTSVDLESSMSCNALNQHLDCTLNLDQNITNDWNELCELEDGLSVSVDTFSLECSFRDTTLEGITVGMTIENYSECVAQSCEDEIDEIFDTEVYMESIKQQLYSGGFNCYGDDDDDKLSTGALVGIIVGSVVAVVLLALILRTIYSRSRKFQNQLSQRNHRHLRHKT